MPEYVKVATTSEFPDCPTVRCVEMDGERIAVVRLEDGYYAVNDRCTHADASLCEGDLVDGELLCPLHFATFSVRTGECTGPPASEDLQTYALRVNGEDIEIERK